MVAPHKVFLLKMIAMALLPVAVFAAANDTDRARQVLEDGLDDKDPNARVQTIIAIGMIGREDPFTHRLQGALEDKDVAVRVRVIQSLVDLRLPQAKTLLLKTMQEDQVPEVSFAAAKALYVIDPAAARKQLMDVYSRETKATSPPLSGMARDFFRQFHTIHSTLLFVVNQGVGFVPVPGAGFGVSAISELTSDSEFSPRASVVLILGKKKSKESTNLLQDALHDEEWSVRAASVEVIANTVRNDLKEMLPPLFVDKNEKVRFRAAAAYLRLNLTNPSPAAALPTPPTTVKPKIKY